MPGAPRRRRRPPTRRCGSSTGRACCGAARPTRRTSATYHDRIDPEGVVRYLVLDPDFPRAMRFCVARCRESLHEISGGDDDGYGSEAERLLGRLDSELRYIDVDEIFDRGLASFLRGVQEACNRDRRGDPPDLFRDLSYRAEIRLRWRDRDSSTDERTDLMLLRIQHETKLHLLGPGLRDRLRGPDGPPVGRGPDEPGLPAPDHPAGAGHARTATGSATGSTCSTS